MRIEIRTQVSSLQTVNNRTERCEEKIDLVYRNDYDGIELTDECIQRGILTILRDNYGDEVIIDDLTFDITRIRFEV